MCGTAAAASSRSTVMRTISEPARWSAATCRAVPSTSAVSVLVIDCTTTGAPPPTVTWPTLTGTALRRGSGSAAVDIGFSLSLSGARGGPCRQRRARGRNPGPSSGKNRVISVPSRVHSRRDLCDVYSTVYGRMAGPPGGR